MRGLVFDDVFRLLDIVGRYDLADQATSIALELNEALEGNAAKFGMKMFIKLTSDDEIRSAVYEFLSGPFEMEPDEVRNMSMGNIIKAFKQLAEKSDLEDFFSAASELFPVLK